MSDDNKAAQAEGGALPVIPQPGPLHSSRGIFSRAEKAVEADGQAVLAAIENWYALHFHKATLAGVSPISADDKALLIQHVTAAINPKE